MDIEVRVLINDLRCHMEGMSEDQRIEVIADLTAGYCTHCGAYVGQETCYCAHDE